MTGRNENSLRKQRAVPGGEPAGKKHRSFALGEHRRVGGHPGEPQRGEAEGKLQQVRLPEAAEQRFVERQVVQDQLARLRR